MESNFKMFKIVLKTFIYHIVVMNHDNRSSSLSAWSAESHIIPLIVQLHILLRHFTLSAHTHAYAYLR